MIPWCSSPVITVRIHFGQVSVALNDWTTDDVRERFAVLSAYRLRSECERRLEEDVDLINGRRIVVDYPLGGELPSLPYQSFIVPMPDEAPHPTKRGRFRRSWRLIHDASDTGLH